MIEAVIFFSAEGPVNVRAIEGKAQDRKGSCGEGKGRAAPRSSYECQVIGERKYGMSRVDPLGRRWARAGDVVVDSFDYR
jgi:hypothetical protein